MPQCQIIAPDIKAGNELVNAWAAALCKHPAVVAVADESMKRRLTDAVAVVVALAAAQRREHRALGASVCERHERDKVLDTKNPPAASLTNGPLTRDV